jgi:hypothetical protein
MLTAFSFFAKIYAERKGMIYPNLAPDYKSRIKSIVVKEFSGIDHLPDNSRELVEGVEVK